MSGFVFIRRLVRVVKQFRSGHHLALSPQRKVLGGVDRQIPIVLVASLQHPGQPCSDLVEGRSSSRINLPRPLHDLVADNKRIKSSTFRGGTHISGGHSGGCGKRLPSSKWWIISNGWIAGYGPSPRVNSSNSKTPYAQLKMIICPMNAIVEQRTHRTWSCTRTASATRSPSI